MYVKVVRSLKIMFEGHKAYQKQLDQILQTSIEPKQSHSGAIIIQKSSKMMIFNNFSKIALTFH